MARRAIKYPWDLMVAMEALTLVVQTIISKLIPVSFDHPFTAIRAIATAPFRVVDVSGINIVKAIIDSDLSRAS